MKLVIFCLLFFSAMAGSAQRVIDVNKTDESPFRGLFYVVGGNPFSMAKYAKVTEGTPYFKDEWFNGVVVDMTDRQYKNVRLKIDLLANTVHYLDDKEKEFTATMPIKQIVLTDGSDHNAIFKFK